MLDLIKPKSIIGSYLKYLDYFHNFQLKTIQFLLLIIIHCLYSETCWVSPPLISHVRVFMAKGLLLGATYTMLNTRHLM